MKKPIVFHPFLFALFHILFLFSYNIEEAHFRNFLPPAIVALAVTLLLFFIIRLFIKNSVKAALILSVTVILFFSYGHIYDMILDRFIGSFEIGRHRFLLLTWAFIFSGCTFAVIRTRKNLYNLTKFLNITVFTLLVFSLYNIIAYELKTKNNWRDIINSGDTTCISENMGTGKSSAEFRDIYYIILDGYASSNVLREIYDYDNQDFDDYLTAQGFYVADKSRANYAMTHLSLSSSLNMEYINYLSDSIGVESVDKTVPNQMIENNKVMNFLKSKGYKYIHFSSGWEVTNRNVNADLSFHSGNVDEFLMVLVQTTMLRPFEKPFIKDVRKSRLYTFYQLAQIPKINDPKFVFAHILLPHPPYLFDRNGGIFTDSELHLGLNLFKQEDNYLNQLIYTNKLIEELITNILAGSTTPPIIIIQADHGPASTFPASLNWQKAGVEANVTDEMLRERLEILNAYYLPSYDGERLYKSITPVNSFRLIFNYYFQTNCELLPDRNYFSVYERPYAFNDITDRLRTP